jgi:hypothetical protein
VGAGTNATEQNSSASSIASSYDTAPSNLEHLTTQGDATSALWNRAKRNGSGSSLNAYTIDSSGHTGRVTISQSASEGSIASRRVRGESYGSASDHSAYYDANSSSVSRVASAGSWRSVPVNQYGGRADAIQSDPSQRGRQHAVAVQQRRSPRRSNRSGEHDEGFTMMASALLNMLDTPEEASAESYSDDDFRYPQARYHLSSEQVDPSMLGPLPLHQKRPDSVHRGRLQDQDGQEISPSWSPTWHGPSSTGLSFDTDGKAISAMQSRHGDTQHSSDVGLYLP